jgi:transcriptional regulator with XRE-family HTH domain
MYQLIDKKIGQKIKEFRKRYGISQIELAERIGISFQQIQKYEKGATRISVMRLQQISEAFDVKITDFIEQREKNSKVSDAAPEYGAGRNLREDLQLLNKEEKTLLRLFRRIKNRKIREGVLKQLHGIMELESPE